MIEGAYTDDVAQEITPLLWQGGYPLHPGGVKAAGFDVIVLAAVELQAGEFPGVEVIRAPMEDRINGPSKDEIRIATVAANKVLDALREGKRVLSTCAAGRNRSGLVSALALIAFEGISGKEAARRVRAAREKALTNPGFSWFLERIPAPGRARSRG